MMISRRSFVEQLGLLGLTSSAALSNLVTTGSANARGLGGLSHEPLFKKYSREFLAEHLKAPFEKDIGDFQKCTEEKFIKTLFSTANKLSDLLTEKYPAKTSHENIKTQIQSMFDALSYCYTALEKKFGKEYYPLAAKYGYTFNYDVDIGLYYNDVRDYLSLEGYKKNLKADVINLFHPLPDQYSETKLEDISSGEFLELFKELFPGTNLPKTVRYKAIEDKSFNSLGRYVYGEIFVSPSKIKGYSERNDSDYSMELNSTLVNELFHLTMNQEYGVDTNNWRQKNQFSGQDFGTGYYVKKNKEVEEAISDLCTLSVNKRSLLEMLTSCYDFSNALAHKVLYEVFPELPKPVNPSGWKAYRFKEIEAWLKQELEKKGINEPDLEKEIYAPAFKLLKEWAIARMQDIRKN